nr:MAG TPA: hypothetical protein [Caudoviricetes sp.]
MGFLRFYPTPIREPSLAPSQVNFTIIYTKILFLSTNFILFY